MRPLRSALVLIGVVALAQSASAQSIFVRKPSQYLGYGYGNYFWNTFTGMWNAAFPTVTTGSTIGSLAGYSALYLDANQPGTSAYNLSGSEISTIGAFLAGGGRVYAFGENNAWGPWDTQLAGLFGATFGGLGADFGTPLVSNNLTALVTSINTTAPGYFSGFGGGIDLFSNHIAGVFNSNAVAVLDVNICSDSFINQADNSQFCQNLVNFTAGAPLDGTVTPEPASMVLLGTGLFGVGVVARRRHKERDAEG